MNGVQYSQYPEEISYSQLQAELAFFADLDDEDYDAASFCGCNGNTCPATLPEDDDDDMPF